MGRGETSPPSVVRRLGAKWVRAAPSADASDGTSVRKINRWRVAPPVHSLLCEGEGRTMAQRVDGIPEDARAAHETAVGLHVAWLVSLVRAFRSEGGRELRHDPAIRTAQTDLIMALLLSCADGTPLDALRARFIDPVERESRVHAEATAVLTDTVRLVERHLARRA